MNSDGQPPHILVVDDAPEILILKREIFEEEGFRVTTRIAHDTALDEIIQIAPDLIIIDYSTEAESNRLHQLTTDLRTEQIPVVLCTGAVRQIEAIRPELDARGVVVVFKPFEIEHLVHVVREVLGLGLDGEESPPSRPE